VALLLVAAVPLIDFNCYFYRLYTHPTYHFLQGERLLTMARELRDRGPGWTGFLLADTFATRHETLRFLSRCWGLQMRDVAALGDVLAGAETTGSALFMMTRSTMAALPVLTGWYRDASSEVRLEPEGRDWWFDAPLPFTQPRGGRAPSAAFVAVADVAAQAPHGVIASFHSADGATIRRAVVRRPEPASPDDATGARTVRWTAILAALRSGPHEFVFPAEAAARLWIDGRTVIAEGRTSGSLDLSRGAHRLVAELTTGVAAGASLLWQPPQQATLEPIPERHLFAVTHGLRVERRGAGKSERSHDVFPYYAFLAPSGRMDESVVWSGRLLVPGPHARRLRVDANGRAELLIDGRLTPTETKLRPGVREIEIRLLPAAQPLRLTVWWQEPRSPWTEVPWEAFAPPEEIGPAPPS
jgi:hypothetical protein